jgi:teichuronic acid biosynthesis glycosyltransferase TuaC
VHVLFLTEDFTRPEEAQGGVRVSVARLAVELAREHQVTVLSPRRIFPPFGRYRETGVPLAVPRSAASSPTSAASRERLRVVRPPLLHVPILWPVTEPVQLLVAGLWVLATDARRADVLHGHRAFPMGFLARLLGHLTGRASVVTVYGTEVNMEAVSGSRLRRWLTRAGLGTGRAIAVSRDLGQKLMALGVAAARVRIVPSGVDVDSFALPDAATRDRARAALGLPLDRFVFLALNLFDPVKGHRVLIEAFGAVARARPGKAFLAMTGDGPERPAIEERARALGLTTDVRFAGLRPYDELAQWVQAADAVVLPSLSEGMPLTVLEGFAAGKPIIGSQVGGIPELVPDPRYGLLVPPGDPEALGRALARALDVPWDRPAIRQWAMEFAWPAVARRVLAVYTELCP